MSYDRIVISSGHGKHIRGASGVLDEVDEARKVVEQVAKELRGRGVDVKTFHDDTSHDQNTNLHTIVNYHNAQTRDLDVSVHFNAYVETSKPMGTECLYVSQQGLAGQVASAIASCGFVNRGPKKRTDLFFLNNTEMPAILLETCFVDSTADAEVYRREFADICDAVADVLGGKEAGGERPPIEPPTQPDVSARVDIAIAVEGNVEVTVNGQTIEIVGHGR
jgi:N-acetylmuramoyl-L-alanine amidase